MSALIAPLAGDATTAAFHGHTVRTSLVLARPLRRALAAALLLIAVVLAAPARSDGLSFLVMDARNGAMLSAFNPDAPRLPGRIAQIMTLHVVWSMAAAGELDLDSSTVISSSAAMEPPLRIGLQAGQRIALRRLVEIVAGYRANDAAAALAEAAAGSRRAFGARMNAMAERMCLANTRFLVEYGFWMGQVTTARDAAVIARHILHEFPEHLPLFAASVVDPDGRVRGNTLHGLGAEVDGLATTYGHEPGYGGVFTAERDGVRLIVVIFGTRDAAARRRMLADLLEEGFARADPLARVVPPRRDGCPVS